MFLPSPIKEVSSYSVTKMTPGNYKEISAHAKRLFVTYIDDDKSANCQHNCNVNMVYRGYVCVYYVRFSGINSLISVSKMGVLKPYFNVPTSNTLTLLFKHMFANKQKIIYAFTS